MSPYVGRSDSAFARMMPENMVCSLIRTYSGHAESLQSLTFSLASAVSMMKELIGLQIFVIYTEAPRNSFKTSVIAALTAVRQYSGVHRAEMIRVPSANKTIREFYGYVETDYGLKYMMQPHFGCLYYLITNGDNLYSRYLFQEIAPLMENGTDIICWTL
jgi:hypothetical protein